jgi:NAD(P)H dehydrogenase (quinone)
MLAVTGASGQLGRLVVKGLAARVPAAEIVGLVRSPEKAADLAALGVTLRQADYSRPETLGPALRGVDALLLVSSSEVGRRVAQHAAVIDAARREGVGLLAYTSILHADTSPLALAVEHKATEERIKASGVPYVFLRNGWYVENYAGFIPSALEHGALIGCAGAGRISCAARADYAEAAVAALTGGAAANTVHELAGDTAFTLAEYAAELARQSGRAVRYTDMAQAEYGAALVGAGLPAGLAEILADSDAGAARGALFDAGAGLSRLTGRPTITLAEAIASALPKP